METKVKQHWLKVDFTRWADPVDAEDSEAEEQVGLYQTVKPMQGFSVG